MEIISGQGGSILPARVANQDGGFALFSRIKENLIKIERGKIAPFFSSVIIFCSFLHVLFGQSM